MLSSGLEAARLLEDLAESWVVWPEYAEAALGAAALLTASDGELRRLCHELSVAQTEADEARTAASEERKLRMRAELSDREARGQLADCQAERDALAGEVSSLRDRIGHARDRAARLEACLLKVQNEVNAAL